MQIISSFTNHSGFDGVMLSLPNFSLHLEFTYQHGVIFNSKVPSKDHLLVFQIEDKEEWDVAVKKVESAGGVEVESENPYWDVRGVTFEDPEGWRIVLQNAAWS